MYSCPACGDEDATGRSICVCGVDLSLLQRLDALGNVWFNRALEALAEGDRGGALEWLSACCAVRPTDVAALLAKSRVWAQLDRFEEARAALSRASAIDPEMPELDAIRQAIEDASKRTTSDGKWREAGAAAGSSRRGTGASKTRNKRQRR